MSNLSRFMHTARTILNEQDRPSGAQPPIFTRTQYLFVEIDEAQVKVSNITARIKAAQIGSDIAAGARLCAELVTITKQLAQLAAWADEQFRKETSNGH